MFMLHRRKRYTSIISGKGTWNSLDEKMKEIGVGKVGTVSGRYYAMDRDNRLGRELKKHMWL